MKRVLIVEDDDGAVATFASLLHAAAGEARLLHASCRNEAVELLEDRREEFDLIVCDLKIPPQPNSLDVQDVYGSEVALLAASRHPETPRLILTGHGDEIDTRRLTEGYGLFQPGSDATSLPLVKLIHKHESQDIEAYLAKAAQIYSRLDSVEVSGGESILLTAFEQRAVAQFITEQGGVGGVISRLGGLSDSKAFKLEVLDPSSVARVTVFAKIGPRADIEDELAAGSRGVLGVIDPAIVPNHIASRGAGSGRSAASFFSLADRFVDTLFAASGDHSRSLRVVERLKESLEPWQSLGDERSLEVGRFRRGLLGDGVLLPYVDELDGASWREFESEWFTADWCRQHGDLHGGNVLVSQSGEPMLVDFADSSWLPSVMDPVSLELSLTFHPDSPVGGELSDHALKFGFLEPGYLTTGPLSDLRLSLREWATAVADEGTIRSVVYAHALRQLKYPQTRKDAAIAIARSVVPEV